MHVAEKASAVDFSELSFKSLWVDGGGCQPGVGCCCCDCMFLTTGLTIRTNFDCFRTDYYLDDDNNSSNKLLRSVLV